MTVDFHVNTIQCPKCGEIQKAKVRHTVPFYDYTHTCIKCGYVITESEWSGPEVD